MGRPPLAEAHKSLRIKWYRSPVDPKLLHTAVAAQRPAGMVADAWVVAYLAATAGLACYFYVHEMWALFTMALFAYGTYSCFLGSACHEFTHGTVFKTKWLNRFFLYLFSLINMFNHEEYLLSHTYHHRYTLHPDGDREVVLPQSPVIRGLFVVQMFTINLFGGPGAEGLYQRVRATFRTAFGELPDIDALGEPIDDQLQEWLAALYTAHPEERRKAVRLARLILLFHAAVIAVAVAFQLWLLPVFITLSRTLANWLKAPAVFLQHAGLRDNVPDFRKCLALSSWTDFVDDVLAHELALGAPHVPWGTVLTTCRG